MQESKGKPKEFLQQPPIHHDLTNHHDGLDLGLILKSFIPLTLLGLAGFYNKRYKVANPNQYLVKTGLFIKDMHISKKSLLLPLQQFSVIDMVPRSYSFNLHAMSKEKMEFLLPCVFTIGPKDDFNLLKTYSRYLLKQEQDQVEAIIKGMIEGETRVLAANMSIEDIFKSRQEFKNHIVSSVSDELSKLGLTIYNANIKELSDSNAGKYFSYLSQKVSADAENQAKIDIAEAQKKGIIGEKEREGESRQKIIQIESQTKIYENEREQEIQQSSALLEKRKSELNQIKMIAEIESKKNSEKRQEELQKEVEIQRLHKEVEKERAALFSKAKVEAEVKIENAKGESSSMQQIADAHLYQKQRESDGMVYSKQKEADGIRSVYLAQAEGLKNIIASFNSDSKSAIQYLMIEKDLYEKLAKESANAIQGLKPNINIWNTGSDTNNDSFKHIQNIVKAIPPMLDAINTQTDIKIPDWLLKQKQQQQQQDNNQNNN